VISIVIVNWNSGPLLERCIVSLLRSEHVYEIVVVDNASEDFSLDFTSRLEFPIEVIRNRKNLGFAAGNNLGWHATRGDPVLFLNPDTEAMHGSIERLGELLEDATIWAAGGNLWSPNGERQAGFNVRTFPTVASVAAEMLLLDELWPSNPWTRRYRMTDWDHASALDVDQPAAACLMVQRRALLQLGGFDESFRPAWFEDVDLCRRIRDRGGRIVFQPAAGFLHHGGSSLKRLVRASFLEYYHTNQLRYFRKHYGESAAQRVRRLVVAGMWLRALISSVYPVIPGASRVSSVRTFREVARHFAALAELPQ